MIGAAGGIDYANTRVIGYFPTALERGIYRTLAAGTAWTPSRMVAAGKLTVQQAYCVHCGQDIVESLGHRFWRCSRWCSIRTQFGLEHEDESLLPRCLTRCGLVPKDYVKDDEPVPSIIGRIQKMLVAISGEVTKSVDAQKQLALARGSEKQDKGLVTLEDWYGR